MKKILELNLIGDRISHLKNTRRVLLFIQIGYFLSFIAFSFMLANIFFVSTRISGSRKKIAVLQNNIQSTRDTFGIKALETEWGSYFVRLMQIERFVNKRTALKPVIVEMSRALPPNAFIAKMTADESAGHKVNIDVIVSPGNRSGLETVNEFMEKIKQSGMVGNNIRIDSQDRMPLNGQVAEVFRLSIVW